MWRIIAEIPNCPGAKDLWRQKHDMRNHMAKFAEGLQLKNKPWNNQTLGKRMDVLFYYQKLDQLDLKRDL